MEIYKRREEERKDEESKNGKRRTIRMYQGEGKKGRTKKRLSREKGGLSVCIREKGRREK